MENSDLHETACTEVFRKPPAGPWQGAERWQGPAGKTPLTSTQIVTTLQQNIKTLQISLLYYLRNAYETPDCRG